MTAAGPCGPVRPAEPVGPAEPTGPTGPVAPVWPLAPAGPMGPCGPAGPTVPAPADAARVMSSSAGWLVRSFSLESSCRLAVAAERARPKLVAGVVIQPCTELVTSKVTYWPAVETWVTAIAAPIEGAEAAVTLYSPQVEVMGESESRPGVSARLTKRRRVAREIWAAVTPVGSGERSNWRRAVEVELTTRLVRVPKLTAGWAVEMAVSAVRVAVAAWAVAAKRPRSSRRRMGVDR